MKTITQPTEEVTYVKYIAGSKIKTVCDTPKICGYEKVVAKYGLLRIEQLARALCEVRDVDPDGSSYVPNGGSMRIGGSVNYTVNWLAAREDVLAMLELRMAEELVDRI